MAPSDVPSSRLLAPGRPDPAADRWLLECLDVVATTARQLQTPVEGDARQRVLDIARRSVAQVAKFEAVAFMALAEDGLDFELVDCSPTEARDEIQREIVAWVRRGDFGHALRHEGAVIRPTGNGQRALVLHPLCGHGGVQAMFVGLTGEPDPLLPEVTAQVISTVLGQCGAALESAALQRTLVRHNEILERLVDERTRELQRSEQEVRNASKAKDEFMANMSHELRTPLNGVVGVSQLLLDSDLSQEQNELATAIHESSQLLTQMVNDLLALCEAPDGSPPVRRSAVDLRTLVEDAVAAARPGADAKGLALTCDVVGVPHRAALDRSAVARALGHLIDNAVKFTATGTVSVRVRGWPEDDCARVRFEISDTGIGIADADRERIFDRFVQVDGSATRRFGGTGIGLALCREGIESLGGSLGVDSEKGAGSTFWISLPMPVLAWSERPDPDEAGADGPDA